MNHILSLLRSLFYPLPVRADYFGSTLLPLLIACVGLIVASFAIRFWRSRMKSSLLRKLSSSWSTTCVWFGLTGLVLIVARAEGIQYVAMRFWWVVWGLAGLAFILLQLKIFRARHYQVIPTVKAEDPRDPYLPRAKRK